MRLTRILQIKRGWLRFPGEPPESFKLIRHGELKWRDYQPKEIDPPYWYRWTTESPYSPQEQNKILTGSSIVWYRTNYKKMTVIPPDEWLYVVGDRVQILEGKDKGKQGEVIQVVPQGNIIVVGGLNCKKMLRDGQASNIEKPLRHDQVSLLDPKSSNPVAVEFKVNEEGKRMRVSKESGYPVEWPPEILSDGTPKCEYLIGDKDTPKDVVFERTYVPTIDNWEDELANAFGISDPPRIKTFWY